MIMNEMKGPTEHLKYYDKYKDLISKKVRENYLNFLFDIFCTGTSQACEFFSFHT